MSVQKLVVPLRRGDKGGRGEVREADEEEEKRARARVLPRQLPPRIKRTM